MLIVDIVNWALTTFKYSVKELCFQQGVALIPSVLHVDHIPLIIIIIKTVIRYTSILHKALNTT